MYLNEIPLVAFQLGHQEGTLDLVERQDPSVLVRTCLSVGFGFFELHLCSKSFFNGAVHD